MGSCLAYAQPNLGIAKEEIIRKAREWAQSNNPPMGAAYTEVQAVYLPDEHVWIVDFTDPSSQVDDSDFMLKVEATSNKDPLYLRGSQKMRYRPFLESLPDEGGY